MSLAQWVVAVPLAVFWPASLNIFCSSVIRVMMTPTESVLS
jgi:hypothetical protein